MNVSKLTVGLIAVGALAALVPAHAVQLNHDADVAQFEQFATEYQQAMNSYNVEQLIPKLEDKMDLWMPLGIQIKNPDDFRSYMKAMANKIGIGNGGNYHVTQAPAALVRYYSNGGTEVYSAGTMIEEVQVVGKTPKKYTSHWLVHMKKAGGAWKIAGGTLEADRDHQAFTASDFNGWKSEIETAMKASKPSKRAVQGGK